MKIDRKKAYKFNNHVDYCVGTGRMGLALTHEYFEQLRLVQGYDHNFAIDHKTGSFDKVAELKCDRTRIKMDVYTDLPGI